MTKVFRLATPIGYLFNPFGRKAARLGDPHFCEVTVNDLMGASWGRSSGRQNGARWSSHNFRVDSVSDTVNPAAMDAPVSVRLSTLQLWMLQYQWHCQCCSYGCSSVSDTVNPAAMDAPISVTLSILQLWMLRSSVSDTVNPAAMDAPVSVTLSILQLWMFQCQWLTILQLWMRQCLRI